MIPVFYALIVKGTLNTFDTIGKWLNSPSRAEREKLAEAARKQAVGAPQWAYEKGMDYWNRGKTKRAWGMA